jgi:hypothetical protein
MNSKKHHPPLLLIAAALVCSSPAFSKEKQEVPTPPPMAKTGAATVFIDTPAEVALQIVGRVAEPLSFLIRKEPKHGKLSGLRRTGRNSAALLYTPDAGAEPGDDFFSFAAQSVDSPVSAPATVWIRLVERPPILEHPSEIEFGKVFLGEKEERPMELQNVGGGVAVGTIRPNSPWHTGKSGEYRLPAGVTSTVPLVFEPLEERDFIDKIPIGPDPKSVVLVRGSGIAPVSWPQEGLVVAPKDRETGRASITFTNNSPIERTLKVEWPEFLKADREVTLPANGALVMKIEISAPMSLKYEGEAEIRSGNFKSKVPIRIFPAPAKLSVSPEQGLKLGATENSRTLTGRILVRNIGGANASLQIIAPLDIHIVPDPSNIILAGGGEQAFEVQAERLKPGSYHQIIRIQSPACKPVDITIEAPAATENRSAVPVENFLSLPASPVPSPTTQLPSGKIPRVETVNLLESTNHEIVISWELSSPKTLAFKIQRRQISGGKNGQVIVNWVPWPEAKITMADGTAVARFERLPANAFWTIRIVTLDESGNPSPPSPAFQISTQPMREFDLPWWVWILPLAALAAGIFRLWKKHQFGLHSKANARIANLEGK